MSSRSIVPQNQPADNLSIVVYRPDGSDIGIPFRADLDEKRMWGSQRKIADTLRVTVQAVGQQVKNFREQRGDKAERSIKKFLILAEDGKTREIEHYDMTLIAYIGFRSQATESVIAFQEWVGEVLDKAIAPKPMTQSELILAQAQFAVEIERRVAALESERAAIPALANEIQDIKDKLVDADYMTIRQYCQQQGLRVTDTVKKAWGRDAAALSRSQGVQILRFIEGRDNVGRYHIGILTAVCVAKLKINPKQLGLIGDGS